VLAANRANIMSPDFTEAGIALMAVSKLAAGVVIVHESERGPRFLLLRAYRNWDLPKGLVEPGEPPFAAACREAEEESGITGLDFAWGSDFVETAPYSGNKVARFYVARTPSDRVVLSVNPVLGRPEHHEYRWVQLDDALALVVPRLQVVLRWAAARMGR
jgi:bis(5'-nucleosidyl)-tetraphosphatase